MVVALMISFTLMKIGSVIEVIQGCLLRTKLRMGIFYGKRLQYLFDCILINVYLSVGTITCTICGSKGCSC